MTLKFNGFKEKRNFHSILNFVLFQKYEMYENKYRTKICHFTVVELHFLSLFIIFIYHHVCWVPLGWKQKDLQRIGGLSTYRKSFRKRCRSWESRSLLLRAAAFVRKKTSKYTGMRALWSTKITIDTHRCNQTNENRSAQNLRVLVCFWFPWRHLYIHVLEDCSRLLRFQSALLGWHRMTLGMLPSSGWNLHPRLSPNKRGEREREGDFVGY